MAEAGPKLQAVPSEGDGPPSASPAGADSGREERLTRWVLAALLVFAVFALVVQTWRARDLHTQVNALSTELSATRAELAAHQAHLIQVRTQVGDLQAGMAELQELVARDPAAR